MSAEAIERLRRKTQNEQTYFAMADLLRDRETRINALRAALIAAMEIVQQERLARSLADSRAFRIVVKRIAALDAIIAQADAALGEKG